MGWAWFGVETNTSVKSEKIPPPPPDYTRVDCERPRIYAGVDPELYPRGRLCWLPESTPPSQDLPLLLLSCEVYSAPRIYPSLPEYTPLFNNYMRPSQNIPFPPRIYQPFLINLCVRQQLYATLPEIHPSPQNIPPFQQLYATFPESTPPPPPEYRPTPLFNKCICATLPYTPLFNKCMCDPRRIDSLPEYTPPPPPFQQLHATLPEYTPISQNISPFQQL